MSSDYASLNGVLDELEDAGKIADPAEVLIAFTDWAEASGKPLYPHQEAAVTAVAEDNHVIVATPTGTGKSLIGLGAHVLALAAGKRSIYTAPLKALVSEKFFDLVAAFGARNVGMITGDVSLNPDAPIICATAEILANRALKYGADSDFEVVIVDEFHYYADPQRGWAWQVPLLELTDSQFILMSATLGDTSFLAADLQARTGRSCVLVADAQRPVPLEFEYQVEPIETIVERTLKQGRFPIYVVHFAQADAVKRAQLLARANIVPAQTQKRAQEAIRGEYFGSGFGQQLRELLRHGIGLHHAGMLPRYRRLVERLAQAGALAVICGTDTLGVGINVPIRTVLFAQLTKFDGTRERQLSAREFHQIAGRAGRAGFDTVGFVIVAAPEHEVENARIAAANAGRVKKKQKVKPKAGTISWSEATFTRLEAAAPETLQPQFHIDHSLVLNVLSGQEEIHRDAATHLLWLALNNHGAIHQRKSAEAEHNRWLRALGQVYESLAQAGVVKRVNPRLHDLDALRDALADGLGNDDKHGKHAPYQVQLLQELPEDFALNQALSPFALAALDLLDPDADTYALDVVSVIEAILEGPRQLLYAQQREERGRVIAALKAEGVEYEERQRIIEDITWPQPLNDVLQPAFSIYRQSNPWLLDRELEPKSVVRYMIEHAMTFSELIARFDLGRSEGVVLRYLTDAYRALRQIVAQKYRNETVNEVISWLEQLVRTVDSSLLDEWEALESGHFNASSNPDSAAAMAAVNADAAHQELAFGADADGYVPWSHNKFAAIASVREALFRIVEEIAADQVDKLAKRNFPGWDRDRWDRILGQLWDEYDWIGIGNEARANSLFTLNTHPSYADLERVGASNPDFVERCDKGELWLATQILDDSAGDHDWRLLVAVDVAATDALHRARHQAQLAQDPQSGVQSGVQSAAGRSVDTAPARGRFMPVLYPLALAPLSEY